MVIRFFGGRSSAARWELIYTQFDPFTGTGTANPALRHYSVRYPSLTQKCHGGFEIIISTQPTSSPTTLHTYIIVAVVLLFPTMLAVAGSLGKKLVRGTDFRRADFFLGPDLTLGALSAGLVNLLDISKDVQYTSNMTANLFFTSGYIAITFFLFIVILSLHQVWEKRDNQPRRQILTLGVASNLIGLSLLVLFVWLKLGGLV